MSRTLATQGGKRSDDHKQSFRAYRPKLKTAIPPSVFGIHNGGKKRIKHERNNTQE